MRLGAGELRAIERLHVRAWPALETADIDGWLWRCSGGGSKRANSVSTVRYVGPDPSAALDEVERRYRERNAAVLVQTYDLSEPHKLSDLLQEREYVNAESTLTMWKAVEGKNASADSEVSDAPGPDWLDGYLGAITEDRRAVNARILQSIPRPNAYFTCRRGGRVISSGLCVADGEFGAVECMATRADVRRQGGAATVLNALEAWASTHDVKHLALQVVATNDPAIALYTRCGFVPVATNRFWIKS
jgi:GNAT superfamily N-acetyltransferase